MNSTVKKLFVLRGLWQFILLQSVAVAFFKSRGMESQQIFWLQSIFLATLCLFDVPSSILTEKWGLKRSLLIGCFLKGLGGVALMFESGIYNVYLAYIFIGLGNAFYSGVDYTLLFNSANPKENRDQQLKNIQGTAHSITLFSILASGIIGAWISEYFGMRVLVIGNAIVAWSSFLLALTIHDEKSAKPSASKYSRQVLREALAVTWAPARRPHVFAMILVGICATLLPYLLQMRAGDEKLSLVIVGYLFAFQNGLGSFLGAMMGPMGKMPWTKAVTRPAVVAALCALSIGVLASGNLVVFAFSIVIMEIVRAMVTVLVNSDFHMSFSQASRPTVSSIISMSSRLISVLLTSVLGMVSKGHSVSLICLVLGAVIVIFGLFQKRTT